MKRTKTGRNETDPTVAPPSARVDIDRTLAERLAVISDPSRMRILVALREGDESCRHIDGYVGIHVSDLAGQLELSQPAVSQHLARLRQSGLVRVTKKGQFAYYLRDEDALADVRRRLDAL